MESFGIRSNFIEFSALNLNDAEIRVDLGKFEYVEFVELIKKREFRRLQGLKMV